MMLEKYTESAVFYRGWYSTCSQESFHESIGEIMRLLHKKRYFVKPINSVGVEGYNHAIGTIYDIIRNAPKVAGRIFEFSDVYTNTIGANIVSYDKDLTAILEKVESMGVERASRELIAHTNS